MSNNEECPVCHENTLRIIEDGGLIEEYCRNCGFEYEFWHIDERSREDASSDTEVRRENSHRR